MSRIGVSVTKEIAFRDNQQEFSNVYYYTNDPGAQPSVSQADAIIDAIVAHERDFHATVVSFVHARLWSAGGTKETNNMITEKTLALAGLATEQTSMDRERAFLIQWEAGFDSRGHKVRLKKWYHTCAQWPGAVGATGTNQLANKVAIGASDRTIISGKTDDILTLAAGGGGWSLCAKSGRLYQSADPGCHKYLEHHQLGDQWRG